MKLKVTITPTADGMMEYIQIISGDQLSVNVVLVAEKIEMVDTRNKKRDAGSPRGRKEGG